MIKNIENETWQVWVQDNFDRETPRLVEVSGVGLENGLLELWLRHLYETVQEGGLEGFSPFNLSLVDAGKSIEVKGDWQGQVRLRGWVFRPRKSRMEHYRKTADLGLLRQIARRHLVLHLEGKTSESLLEAVVSANSRQEFEIWLGEDQ